MDGVRRERERERVRIGELMDGYSQRTGIQIDMVIKDMGIVVEIVMAMLNE